MGGLVSRHDDETEPERLQDARQAIGTKYAPPLAGRLLDLGLIAVSQPGAVVAFRLRPAQGLAPLDDSSDEPVIIRSDRSGLRVHAGHPMRTARNDLTKRGAMDR